MPSSLTLINKGLSSEEARARHHKFGYNEIPEKEKFTVFKIFFSQFTSLLVIILIIAGSISMLLKEVIDGLAIFAIVVINAIIGFIQEYNADNAVKALKKLVIPKTIVIRNGKKIEIAIRELVPDDIVILNEGDKIPADLEIIEAFSLKVDESMLTGESITVSKNPETENKLFKGTLIVSGRAKAKVLSIGTNTKFGQIVEMVSKQEEERSPLALQLDEVGKKAGIIILILVAIVFALGTFREISLLKMLMVAVALGVSAIPEGLPIIVTLTLAMGVQILAYKKAIVRKMNAVETLGATTIICSDKTGTLTLNEMTVKKVYADFKETEIEGQGYGYTEKTKLESLAEKKLLVICENCNNSDIDGKNVLGDPTEIALKVLTRKARFVKTFKELDENVFTSERKIMSTLVRTENKKSAKKEVLAKGAYEEILKRCNRIIKNGKIVKISSRDKQKIKKTADEYADNALRVLGFAYKEFLGEALANSPASPFDEKNLIFVGLVGMMDPPRKTVKQSIQICQKAGIKIRIITGDNAITAKAIGKLIGMKITHVKTGDEIDKMSDKELKIALQQTEIFARTNPAHKYRIVDILKKNHEIVAVTGDGVNDAPALKHADVGVAMGIKGTEATKEVADIVLKDDNFTTIVNAIEEGRRIYQNILAFIKYLLSANYDSITTVGILTIIGLPLPLLPLHILWINLATDSLPALALGRSPAEKDTMSKPPHPKRENIFKKFFPFITVAAISQTLINLGVYFYGANLDKNLGIDTANLSQPSLARTMVFTQIVLFELFFVFVCKEEKSFKPKELFNNKYLVGAVTISLILQIIMIYTPFMQTVFKTAALGFKEWIILIILSSSAFLIPRITNLFKKPN
ncbi:cation-translocating P-type ATPase [Candidatus Peregrinibacteria bacterium]|nr:cation-translocating P-type ATPase [Candidatus Peregrinibacteria bacterium]